MFRLVMRNYLCQKRKTHVAGGLEVVICFAEDDPYLLVVRQTGGWNAR